jgi:hypothetical protein
MKQLLDMMAGTASNTKNKQGRGKRMHYCCWTQESKKTTPLLLLLLAVLVL